MPTRRICEMWSRPMLTSASPSPQPTSRMRLPGRGFSVSLRNSVKSSSHQLSRRCLSVGDVNASMSMPSRLYGWPFADQGSWFLVPGSGFAGSGFRVVPRFEVRTSEPEPGTSRTGTRNRSNQEPGTGNQEPLEREPGTVRTRNQEPGTRNLVGHRQLAGNNRPCAWQQAESRHVSNRGENADEHDELRCVGSGRPRQDLPQQPQDRLRN